MLGAHKKAPSAWGLVFGRGHHSGPCLRFAEVAYLLTTRTISRHLLE